MCMICSWFVSISHCRMCQLSAPTHRSGGNCLIQIRNASITTMRPHRRPCGIGRASVTLFRWPSCRHLNRTPIPASAGNRLRHRSNRRRCQSIHSHRNNCSSSSSRRCRQPIRRGVANEPVAAMELWPHPRRSSAAQQTVKWSLVREAVKVFGEKLFASILFTVTWQYLFIYIPLWNNFCSVGTGDSSRSMDLQQQPQAPHQQQQGYASRRSQGKEEKLTSLKHVDSWFMLWFFRLV